MTGFLFVLEEFVISEVLPAIFVTKGIMALIIMIIDLLQCVRVGVGLGVGGPSCFFP